MRNVGLNRDSTLSCFPEAFDGPISSQSAPTTGLFHDGLRWLVRWKTLLLFLVAYDAFILPFEWAFVRLDTYSKIPRHVGLFIDMMFGCDIFVQLNTSRLVNGCWVTDRCELAKSYFKSWFIIDLISAFPSELVIYVPLRWLKIVRIFGLLRVVKFSRMAHTIQNNFKLSTSFYRIIRFGVMVLLAIHWFACLFYALNHREDPSDQAADPGIKSHIEDFVTSLHWSMATIVPIGYGDVGLTTMPAQFFAIFIMAFGMFIFTFAITKGVRLVQQLSSFEQQKFKDKMDRIERLLDHINVPDGLRNKIVYFFRFSNRATIPVVCNEKMLIADLSRQLRTDVINAVNNHEISDMFVVDCAIAMETMCFPPNDDLDELVDSAVCVVISGTLLYGDRIIGPGARFGRLSHSRHGQRSPITRTWCQISVLKRQSLIRILLKHRNIQRLLCGKSGLKLRMTMEKQERAAWVQLVVCHLTLEQAKALLLTVEALHARLEHQEKLTRVADRVFSSDIIRQAGSSCSPSQRAVAFTMEAFSTPSVHPQLTTGEAMSVLHKMPPLCLDEEPRTPSS